MRYISYYPEGIMQKKGIDNYPTAYITFNELIDKMRSPLLKSKIESIRGHKYGSYSYKYEKKKLPVALFNKFKYNLNDGIISENPIKPFDVDLSDNTEDEIRRFKKSIKKRAIMVIDSPSGKGCKFFLARIFDTLDPIDYYDKYKSWCRDIEDEFNIVLDHCQGRIKQPFFLTYINN